MKKTIDNNVIKCSELSNNSDITISLKGAIDMVNEMPVMKDNSGTEFIEKSLTKLRLKLLPSAQPERKTGHWIEEPRCFFRCSECGCSYSSIRGYMTYNFCPNCGKIMIKKEPDGDIECENCLQ